MNRSIMITFFEALLYQIGRANLRLIFVPIAFCAFCSELNFLGKVSHNLIVNDIGMPEIGENNKAHCSFFSRIQTAQNILHGL